VKGKLRLDSAEAIVKGGKDGKIITAGEPGKSDLFRRIVLSKDDDDVMPPEGDLLPKDKAQLIKQWIAQGASFGNWKADTGVAAAPAGQSDNALPAEPQLPKVAVADAGAIDKIRQTGALAMPLAQNTNLVEVDLNLVGDHVDNTQLALLTPVDKQLAVLNLARTKVTDDGLKALESLPNLRKLHLENTKVTDAGLTHVKGLSNLEYLNLYGTQVTDAGLADLDGLKNLKALYLWQTKVTPAGVAKLQQALPKCQINTGWEQAPAAAQVASAKPGATVAETAKPAEKPAAEKPVALANQPKVTTYQGKIQNGSIVLDGSQKLPDGAIVTVVVIQPQANESAKANK
ncbi:MAG TPA: c-type cytochrome domain-containing protein, partial [Tepidisphaeraceae bacterium]|nr:c-type cytochrome domain-containing protein [Tepidisphaeraceae bacterium]